MDSGVQSLHLLLIMLCCSIDMLWARDPFAFVDRIKKKEVSVRRPELQSVTHGKAMSLALIKFGTKAFVVGLGQTVEQWRVREIASTYVVLVDKSGSEKKIILDA